MKKILIIGSLLILNSQIKSQETIYPVKKQTESIYITNASIHIGDGNKLENGTIKIKNGKIEELGADIIIEKENAKIYDAKGKQVYPGLILPMSTLGLQEIIGIRSMQDFYELGEWNSNVKSIAAYTGPKFGLKS
jgi:imidazolonepropionase-like amidohydrolase